MHRSLFPRAMQAGNPVNRRSPFARSLEAFWHVIPQRYGGARWLDVRSRHHGTLLGMGPSSDIIGWGSTARRGGYGELRFGSVDDAIQVPDHPALQLNGAFTIAFFIRITTNVGNIVTKFVGGSASTANDLRGIRLQTTNMHVTHLGANPLSANTTAYLNTWLHVVVTSWATGSEMAFNGVSVSTSGTSLNQWFNNTGPVRFGEAEAAFFGSGSTPFFGALDAMMFYGRSMDLRDMQGLTREATLGFPTLLRREPLWMASEGVPHFFGHDMRGGFQRALRGGFLN